jgi:hypothetical protein
MSQPIERVIDVPASAVSLKSVLSIPNEAQGIVVFPYPCIAEPDNRLGQLAAQEMATHQLATLRIEPHAEGEQPNGVEPHVVGDRLIAATWWIVREQSIEGLPIGLFGLERSSEPVLTAAAAISDVVRAVVAAGGRPNVSAEVLASVEAPTLLVAPGEEREGLERHKFTLASLHVEKKLEVMGGVDTLLAAGEVVGRTIRLAGRWFERFLRIDRRLLGHSSPIVPRR